MIIILFAYRAFQKSFSRCINGICISLPVKKKTNVSMNKASENAVNDVIRMYIANRANRLENSVTNTVVNNAE